MGKQYTPLKIFHFKEKLDSLPNKTEKITSPLHVRLKPTNKCNHNCFYCAYRVEQLQLGKDMIVKDEIPQEKMKEILNDLIEMNVKSVTFTGGGEPLCYPFFLNSIKTLANSPIKFRTYTNGSRLEGEVAEVFAHHGSWMRISMDGWDDESYTRYRGIKDKEYTKIMSNLENFKSLGGNCNLGVSLIIDKKNAGHLFNMIQNLKNVGVDSVKVSPCIISNEGEENNKYHEPIFQKVKEQTRKAKGLLSEENFEISDSYNKQLISFEKEHDWCPYIQIRPVIGADLNIYSCQDKAYNLDSGLIGSIKNKSFKEFWFSDKNNFFKINPLKDCNHHCVADKENRLILDYLDVDKNQLEFV